MNDQLDSNRGRANQSPPCHNHQGGELATQRLARFWLTVFGAGYCPVAPGTCGSAVVAAVMVPAVLWGASPWWLSGIALAFAVHGAMVTVYYGNRLIGPEDDPSWVVSDEEAGQGMAYLLAGIMPWQMGCVTERLAFVVLGFVVFRVFDIVKPPPIRQLERLHGAWGVLLDDMAGGALAAIVLWVAWTVAY